MLKKLFNVYLKFRCNWASYPAILPPVCVNSDASTFLSNLIQITKALGTKGKIRETGHHQSTSKDTVKKVKGQPTEW